MNIDILINIKTKDIEEKTPNDVVIEICNSINVAAALDFGDWHDMTQLPKILYKEPKSKVDILHELIHLEKFFVDQYSIVATNDKNLHPRLDIFKNIPEDYVAHKIIYEYGFNPIDKQWFDRNKTDLSQSDNEVAANLINYHAFCEYRPEYKNQLNSFRKSCEEQKILVYEKAIKVIDIIEKMDYNNKSSYNNLVKEIIKIFEPEYYQSHKIYPSYIFHNGQRWQFNR